MNGVNLDFDHHINEIVRESFKSTNKYIWKGVFSFLFYFSALFTLKDGVLPILAQNFPGTGDENDASSDRTISESGTLREDALTDMGGFSENLSQAIEVVAQKVNEENSNTESQTAGIDEDPFGTDLQRNAEFFG